MTRYRHQKIRPALSKWTASTISRLSTLKAAIQQPLLHGRLTALCFSRWADFAVRYPHRLSQIFHKQRLTFTLPRKFLLAWRETTTRRRLALFLLGATLTRNLRRKIFLEQLIPALGSLRIRAIAFGSAMLQRIFRRKFRHGGFVAFSRKVLAVRLEQRARETLQPLLDGKRVMESDLTATLQALDAVRQREASLQKQLEEERRVNSQLVAGHKAKFGAIYNVGMTTALPVGVGGGCSGPPLEGRTGTGRGEGGGSKSSVLSEGQQGGGKDDQGSALARLTGGRGIYATPAAQQSPAARVTPRRSGRTAADETAARPLFATPSALLPSTLITTVPGSADLFGDGDNRSHLLDASTVNDGGMLAAAEHSFSGRNAAASGGAPVGGAAASGAVVSGSAASSAGRPLPTSLDPERSPGSFLLQNSIRAGSPLTADQSTVVLDRSVGSGEPHLIMPPATRRLLERKVTPAKGGDWSWL